MKLNCSIVTIFDHTQRKTSEDTLIQSQFYS